MKSLFWWILLLATSLARPAYAQSSVAQGAWELELYLGVGRSASPEQGRSVLPPAADPFVVPGGRVVPAVYSWFFGDGNIRFLQAQTPDADRPLITPLDSVLTRAPGFGGSSAEWGARVRRRVARYIAVEGALTYVSGGLEFDSAAINVINESRRTFETAWMQFFSESVNVYVNPAVTSSASVTGGSGGQWAVTGSIVVSARPEGRTVPYVLLGTGGATGYGSDIIVTLEGNYRFLAQALIPIDETDRVVIRVSDRASPIALVGGGFKFALSPSWSLGADVRASFRSDTRGVEVSANPTAERGSPPGAVLDTRNLAISFSTADGVRTSLSALPIEQFETFDGSGRRVHLGLGFSVIRRF